MPRPRFASLDAERRQTILTAAASEFAERGFSASSYNRIIARSGSSKGAMYYYFDDKADLFRTTLQRALERAGAAIGSPLPFDSADGFWHSLRDIYARVTRFVTSDPALANLLRSALTSTDSGARAFVEDITGELLTVFSGFLARGAALGAVRSDLPTELLARMVLGMADASDRWMLERWETLSADELERYPEWMFDLHRRVLEQPFSASTPLPTGGTP